MKYILLAFLLIGSAKAQSFKKDSSWLSKYDSSIADPPYQDYLQLVNPGITWEKPTKFFLLFNGDKVTNDEVLKIDGDGNLFYKPKYFSECDTSTKMRFLYNIHTGEFKKTSTP